MTQHADDLKRVPILLDLEVRCPLEGFVARLDGFASAGELLELVVPDQREVGYNFLKQQSLTGKIMWRDEWSPLRWCPACDVPLLQEVCGLCGGSAGPQIELKFPCNPRPLIPHDEFLFQAAGLPWPMQRAVVVNVWSRSGQTGWELVWGGKVAGDIVYSPREDNYTFQSAGFGLPVFGTNDDRGSLTLATMVKANLAHLDAIEREAIDFIREWCGKGWHRIPVVTFSGGKDSVVLAHLCHLAGARMRLVQIDTGIDPPGNHEYGDRLLSSFPKLKPTRLCDGDIFWRALEKLGPPANDFQWCRVVLKNSAPFRSRGFGPLRALRFIKAILPIRVVLIDGPRKREEPWRITLKKVVPIPDSPIETVTIRPILDFTDLDIWMHLERHRIEANPTYTREKHQRLVCLFCPEKDCHEIRKSRELEPEAWSRFEKELDRWRKIFGFPAEWRSRHLWRSNQPTSSYMRELGVTSRLEMVAARLNNVFMMGAICREGERLTVTGHIEPRFDVGRLAGWLRPLGKVRRRGNVIFLDAGEVIGRIDSKGEVELSANDEAILSRRAELLRDWTVSWLNCIGCGVCRSIIWQVRIKRGRAILQRLGRVSQKSVEEVVANCPMNAKGIRRCLVLRQDS